MGRVIAIANQKGGVGKTTTTVNLAAALADLGQRVVVVDLDPQANATSGLGVAKDAVGRGSYEGLLGHEDFPSLVVPGNHERLSVVPSTPALAGANVELVPLERREYALADRLGELVAGYDFTLIDCPPSLGLLTVNALTASDDVLVPVQCEYYALEGLGQLLETLKLVRENLNERLAVRGAILTMYEPRSELSLSVHRQMYEFFPHFIFRTVIPRSVKLAEAPSFGKSVFAHAPRSKGANAYRRLGREFMERINV
ncbi:MAG: ParA family protein [Candidatus Kerfeldbacteria bacterium]|nr:ParA family protein [Candidatus Kerfeldbacteria bacterium]